MNAPSLIHFDELLSVHPAPWCIEPDPDCPGQFEAKDADGDCVMSFDGEDDGWFWRGLVAAVNDAAFSETVQRGEAPR